FTANLGTRNDLYEIRTQAPCGDNLRRGQRSRNHDHALVCCQFDHFWMESVTGQELGPGFETLNSNLRVRHPARSYYDPGNALQEMRDDLSGLGHGQCDFDNRDPAASYRCGGEKGILRRVHANRGNDAGFLDPAPHLVFLHLIVSFSCAEPEHTAEHDIKTRPRLCSVHRFFSVAKVSVPRSTTFWQRR